MSTENKWACVMAALCGLLLSACVAPELPDLCEPGECFSMDLFGDALRAEMEASGVAGWAFVISQNSSQLRQEADGWARLGPDSPQTAMYVDTRINIASVTKTVTAIATLQALERNLGHLSVADQLQEPIVDYLPSDWDIGPNVGGITFEELLTHTSGFRPNMQATDQPTYQSLRDMVADGVNLSDKFYAYRNHNFGLLRIIIPYLEGFSENGVNDIDLATINAYKAFIDTHIMAVVNRFPVDTAPVGDEYPLYYTTPPNGDFGHDFGDWTRICGGGGLHLSARDLAFIFGRMRFGNSPLLNSEQQNEMRSRELGWYDGTTPHGDYMSHSGYIGWGAPNTGFNGMCTATTCFAASSIFVDFDNGLQVVVVCNGTADLMGAVTRAYDAAWEPATTTDITAAPIGDLPLEPVPFGNADLQAILDD